MRVLVVGSENGDTFYEIASDFQLGFICVKILRERLAENYYYDNSETLELPDVAEELVETLPSPKLVEQYRQKWRHYHCTVESMEAEGTFLSRLHNLLDSPAPLESKANEALGLLQENQSDEDSIYFANLQNPCWIGSGIIRQVPSTLPDGHYRVVKVQHNRVVFPGDLVRIEHGHNKSTYVWKGENRWRIHETGIIDLEVLPPQNNAQETRRTTAA